MYRNTRFGELLKGLPRGTFEKSVKQHQADKYSKGFRSWDQLISMIYAQISGSQSLRELEAGFNSQAAHHYHLGCREIKRSTLADANAKRNSDVFATVCGQLLQQAHRKVKKELKELLYLIDSTPIPLKGLGYDDWTSNNKNHRTQGLKVHMVLAPKDAAPVRMDITAPNINDVNMGRKIAIEAGATYVFDKGYYDYNWWYAINEQKAHFVTRFKKNASVKLVEKQLIPKEAQETILEDAVVQFKNKHPGGGRKNDYYDTSLRRIIVDRPNKDTPLTLVTNDFKRSAVDIAALYKQRWEIELFFKWLKQNLKIKQFLGRSENAVKIQIYTAVITYLLAQLYRKEHNMKVSLKMCLVELRACLFQRPNVEREAARKRRRWRLEYQELQGALAL